MRPHRRSLATILALAVCVTRADAQSRARDLGIPQNGRPGPLNAVTDVPGVEVGLVTIVRGEGRLLTGTGPVRTGVTAILPRGRAGGGTPVFAGWFALNGNGEMTGTTWLQESGFLAGPVMITNTHSIGAVHQGVIAWAAAHGGWDWSLPVVAETWDGYLNDINGLHVTPADAMAAIDAARSGPVPEGNVGGGTGMRCHRFKGGTGTASREVGIGDSTWVIGILVQCNYGSRERLEVAGVPVGREITDLMPCMSRLTDGAVVANAEAPPCDRPGSAGRGQGDAGSIIVVVATDAPLLPHQLTRLATRAALGIGRMGGIGGDSSGDIFIAFSTANPDSAGTSGIGTARFLPNDAIDPLFEAVIDGTAEAILNAMLAAETMTGADGYRLYALPHDRLLAAMRKYGRMR